MCPQCATWTPRTRSAPRPWCLRRRFRAGSLPPLGNTVEIGSLPPLGEGWGGGSDASTTRGGRCSGHVVPATARPPPCPPPTGGGFLLTHRHCPVGGGLGWGPCSIAGWPQLELVSARPARSDG